MLDTSPENSVHTSLTRVSFMSIRVPLSEIFFGTIGFRLGDGIRCLEPEAQNAVLSLEVAKIQFSN